MTVDTLEGSQARTTYRYLRLAMAVLLGSIAVSVLYEAAQNPQDCLQRSISAYYYTPARAIFVSAVVAIGVSLVSLRGSSRTEDAFLNLAGMFAPVVALVPTPNPGTCTSNSLFGLPLSDRSLTELTDEQRAVVSALQADARSDAVLNNMTVVLAAGAICLIVAFLMVVKGWSSTTGMPQWVSPVTAGSALVLYGIAVYVFNQHEIWFLKNGHNFAAVLMFVCIVAVVVLNGRGLGRKKRKDARQKGRVLSRKRAYFNRYSVLAALMVGSALTILWAGSKGFAHATFTVEAVLLGLFLIFWVLQTEELWNEGLREQVPDEGAQPSPGPVPEQPSGNSRDASGSSRPAGARQV